MFTKKVVAQNAMETTGQNYLQCDHWYASFVYVNSVFSLSYLRDKNDVQYPHVRQFCSDVNSGVTLMDKMEAASESFVLNRLVDSEPQLEALGKRLDAIQEAFLGRDNRILNGPLGRSLCSLARNAHSAHWLCSAQLCFSRSLCSLAPFTGSLTHFAHSFVG